MIHNHWLKITHHDSLPLAQQNTPWLKTTRSRNSQCCESWCAILSQWLWIRVRYAEPLVVNHGKLWSVSGCVSWCVIQESVVLIDVVLCWASGWKSRCGMVSQWLWVIVNYDELVVVSHSLLWWASCCESWWVMVSYWLCIMVCYTEPVVMNHGVLCLACGCDSGCVILITQHDSQPLAHHNLPWFTTTGSE
jgi:hypothetical protein